MPAVRFALEAIRGRTIPLYCRSSYIVRNNRIVFVKDVYLHMQRVIVDY